MEFSEKRRNALRLLAGATAASVLPGKVLAQGVESLYDKLALAYHHQHKDFLQFYGYLYRSEDLLNPNFVPKEPEKFILTPEKRLYQYFIRNGTEKTFANAHKLGFEVREFVMERDGEITKLFKDAGINLEGKVYRYLYSTRKGRSYNIYLDPKNYGGEERNFALVQETEDYHIDTIYNPAKKVGYSVDLEKEHKSATANEILSEIMFQTFRPFRESNTRSHRDELVESLKTFKVFSPPNTLFFRNNFQIEEFLSDVVDWQVGVSGRKADGIFFRLVNPLSYIRGRLDGQPIKDFEKTQYYFSYQVQRYAMEQILKSKGFDPKPIMDKIFNLAESEGEVVYLPLLELLHKYFNERDFKEIARVYREIGVEVLKRLKGYQR
jgi:hypothetical protein